MKGIWPSGHKKTLNQLPLMECTCLLPSPPSLPSLRRTWWEGLKDGTWRERIKRKQTNRGSPGRMTIKPACVSMCRYH